MTRLRGLRRKMLKGMMRQDYNHIETNMTRLRGLRHIPSLVSDAGDSSSIETNMTRLRRLRLLVPVLLVLSERKG